MKEHDVLIIGGGHNELTLAAYLAKAGVDVGVFERRSFVGGGVLTLENVVPGFKCETDSVAHQILQSSPTIVNDELELQSRYGLEYLYAKDPTTLTLFEDGVYWEHFKDVDKSCESMARYSERDAEQYRRFFDYSLNILEFLRSGLFMPAPGLGNMFQMLDTSPEGQDIMRYLLMSSWDVVSEWFEDDHTKAALMKLGNETMMYPEAKGTGLNLFLMVPMQHLYEMATPRGGGSELPNSLVRCIEDHGGTIYLESEVDSIVTKGNKAVGVKLVGGEEYGAKRAVASGIHPKITFSRFLSDLPEDFMYRLNRVRPCSHSTLTTNYALNEKIKYKNPVADSAFAVEFLPSLDGFRQHYDDCRYGIPPRQPVPYVACHDQLDDSKSPAGKCSIQFYDPSPYWLRDGGPERWDEIKEQQEDVKLAWLRKFATNMGPENIIGRTVRSPLDLEKWNPNYMEGDIMGGVGGDLYQFMGARPIPQLGQYRTPVESLYGCGPAYHPGGGVTCGGRAPAMVMMEDFGIDFDKVIG